MSEPVPLAGVGWRGLEALADSGVLVALTASALLAAAARTLGSGLDWSTSTLVFCGSLGVYLFDRLRDRNYDRRTHPERAARFDSHSAVITLVAGACVGLAAVLVWQEPQSVRWLLVGVAVLALAHHVLKSVAWFKPLYVALSWWAVTMGVPLLHHWQWVDTASLEIAGRTAVPLGLAIGANVLACDAADRDAEAIRLGPLTTWRIARAVACCGCGGGLLLGGVSARLAWIPALVLLSLLPFRPTARWTTTAVDGSLLLGALVVLLLD